MVDPLDLARLRNQFLHVERANRHVPNHGDLPTLGCAHKRAGSAGFKMDELCKLAYLGSEMLLKNDNFLECNPPNEIGVILSNCASSLDIDIKHQK